MSHLAPPADERRPATGAQLTEKAWAIVTADRRLLVFPLLSAVLLSVAGLVVAGVLVDRGTTADELPLTVVVVGAILAFPLTVVATFCNVAFLAMVEAHLRGEQPDAWAALRLAYRRLPAILAWSAVAATVGALIRLIDRLPGGALVTGLLQIVLGLAWAAATMFVTPLLVLRPGTPQHLLRESTGMLRRRFGTSVVGSVAIGTVGAICAIPFCVLAGIGATSIDDGVPLGALFLTIGIVGAVLILTLVSATAETFHLVVYRYTTTGQVTGTFTETELAHDAVRHRGQTVRRFRAWLRGLTRRR